MLDPGRTFAGPGFAEDNGTVRDDIVALIPPAVMATLFVVLLVVAFRATDGARRRRPRNGFEIGDTAARPASRDHVVAESDPDGAHNEHNEHNERDPPTDS
jgi:hypothetical protein